jgi:hypothetical protein
MFLFGIIVSEYIAVSNFMVVLIVGGIGINWHWCWRLGNL